MAADEAGLDELLADEELLLEDDEDELLELDESDDVLAGVELLDEERESVR